MTKADSVHSMPPLIASAIVPQNLRFISPPMRRREPFSGDRPPSQGGLERNRPPPNVLNAIHDPDPEDGGDAEPDLGSVGMQS